MTAPKPSLDERLSHLATTPVLLVACDYDGTLAPIVSDPGTARPLPEAVSALRALAILADTNVALISGRALHDLALLSRLRPPRRADRPGSPRWRLRPPGQTGRRAPRRPDRQRPRARPSAPRDRRDGDAVHRRRHHRRKRVRHPHRPRCRRQGRQ